MDKTNLNSDDETKNNNIQDYKLDDSEKINKIPGFGRYSPKMYKALTADLNDKNELDKLYNLLFVKKNMTDE